MRNSVRSSVAVSYLSWINALNKYRRCLVSEVGTAAALRLSITEPRSVASGFSPHVSGFKQIRPLPPVNAVCFFPYLTHLRRRFPYYFVSIPNVIYELFFTLQIDTYASLYRLLHRFPVRNDSARPRSHSNPHALPMIAMISSSPRLGQAVLNRFLTTIRDFNVFAKSVSGRRYLPEYLPLSPAGVSAVIDGSRLSINLSHQSAGDPHASLPPRQFADGRFGSGRAAFKKTFRTDRIVGRSQRSRCALLVISISIRPSTWICSQRMADFSPSAGQEAAHARCRQRIVHVKFAGMPTPDRSHIVHASEIRHPRNHVHAYIVNVIRCKISRLFNERSGSLLSPLLRSHQSADHRG